MSEDEERQAAEPLAPPAPRKKRKKRARPRDEELAPTPAPEPAAPLRERMERRFVSFFAVPSDGTTAALFRVLFGAEAVWQAVGILWNIDRYWGPQGTIPFDIVAKDEFIWMSAFRWAPASATFAHALGIAFAIAAVCLFIGFYPRVATLVVAYLHLSFQFRNPFILNSGDRLFMIVAALAAFMPLGHRFSVDALLRARRGRAPPEATVWGQRLVGMQIAYVYLNSAVAKLSNPRWQNGMALRDVLSSPVFAEWPHYVDNRAVIYFFTYMTLALELAFPVLVWWKRYRPWMLLWGIAFHAGIDATMIIPIFSSMMVVSYAAYLSDEETAWLVRKVFRRGGSERKRESERALRART